MTTDEINSTSITDLKKMLKTGKCDKSLKSRIAASITRRRNHRNGK